MGSFESHPVPQLPINVAPDVVSFHYVSSMEASILFRVLSKRVTPTADELRAMWPKNDKDSGPYSRWRFKSDEELGRLHTFLTSEVHVKSPKTCT